MTGTSDDGDRDTVGRETAAGDTAGRDAGNRAGRGAAYEDAPPTEVGGGVYLYHYAPVDLEGVDDRTEVYAAYVTVDLRDWLHALVEYDDWLRTPSDGGEARRLDRSVNLVLLVAL